MSVSEILQEMEKLSPEDRNVLRQELDEKYIDDFAETPEMLAAIEEGLRSSREEPSCTIEDLREDMKKWPSHSK